MKSVSLLLLVSFLLVPTVARPWLNVTAHPAINTEALAYFFAHEGSGEKYKYSPVDRTTVYTGIGVLESGWFNAPDGPISKNITGWLGHGGYSADEPEVYAALRHFYDPLALNGGVSYLTDHIDEFCSIANPGMDAKTWGLTAPDNLYRWKKGLEMYKYAMEMTDSREANLTLAYRALGETMHLIADMTLPAHVRNDSHPWSDPLEGNVTGAMVIASKGYPVDSRVSLDGLPGNLFDQLATFTNQYFYSNDTIFDEPSDTLPFNELAHYPSPQFKDLTYDPKRCVYSGTFNGIPVPMIEETASFYVLKMVLLGYSARVTKYHVPPTYASGYARVLIPIAIHANAKMIDMFFPTINLTLTTTNIGNNQVHLQGEMKHDDAKDPAWQELGMGAIKYTGPGAVMTSSNGTASNVADVIFDKGVMTPIDINVPLSGASSLYLQVTAGGRIFTSPVTVGGGVPLQPFVTAWDFSRGRHESLNFHSPDIATWTCNGSVDAPGLTVTKDKIVGDFSYYDHYQAVTLRAGGTIKLTYSCNVDPEIVTMTSTWVPTGGPRTDTNTFNRVVITSRPQKIESNNGVFTIDISALNINEEYHDHVQLEYNWNWEVFDKSGNKVETGKQIDYYLTLMLYITRIGSP